MSHSLHKGYSGRGRVNTRKLLLILAILKYFERGRIQAWYMKQNILTFHPSRSLSLFFFKHPVSCIEPGKKKKRICYYLLMYTYQSSVYILIIMTFIKRLLGTK